MKRITYPSLSVLFAVLFLILGACSEEEASDITPLVGKDIPLENSIDIEKLKLGVDDIVASNGETTITISQKAFTRNNTFGPFRTNGTLTIVKRNQRYFVPAGYGLAAGYYLCDVWESGGFATIPSGSFAFNYSAATQGFISPNINANNIMSTAQGTGINAFGSSVKFITHSVVPMYNLLGQRVSPIVLPRNLPQNNAITYFYFQPS